MNLRVMDKIFRSERCHLSVSVFKNLVMITMYKHLPTKLIVYINVVYTLLFVFKVLKIKRH